MNSEKKTVDISGEPISKGEALERAAKGGGHKRKSAGTKKTELRRELTGGVASGLLADLLLDAIRDRPSDSEKR